MYYNSVDFRHLRRWTMTYFDIFRVIFTFFYVFHKNSSEFIKLIIMEITHDESKFIELFQGPRLRNVRFETRLI